MLGFVVRTPRRPSPGGARYPLDVKIGLGLLLAALAAGCASSACRVEAGRAGDDRRPDSADAATPVVDDGSGGRWDYLLAKTPRREPGESWDGRRHGPVTEWYDNGAKKEEGAYRNDLKQGPWTYWYDNGQKRWEGTYRDGHPDGPERAWYENGLRRYEGAYSGGKRSGPFTSWYDNGQKEFEGEYAGGLREGNFTFWNRDGSVDEARTGFYLRGRKVSG